MSNFKLNLPTDIPWERICVTEDMIDRVVCDNRLPAKWQSSLAVFKFKPEDEFQLYPKYNITYLKIVATIASFQPLDKEIHGKIDWDGMNNSPVPGFTELLNSFHPCTGAILQVVVGPKGLNPAIPLKDYPFFMDFEPKKRELYELATDTKEKQSRSIESLNITKSSGSTQSLEILDVDMGGGGYGANASYAGTGGGFTYTAPNGQWGTKRLNADESLSSRSSDVGQEKRETFSFSTQISQMYHLLDSYHLGTNRVVFYIQPRPHTLEEPSGFVRGPRPLEGIQEFFMVVAQLKGQEDYCVSLRLDTSHLVKVPNMVKDTKTENSELASASVSVPTEGDAPDGIKIWGVCHEGGIGGDDDEIIYRCYKNTKTDPVKYNAPPGYVITGWNDFINQTSGGLSGSISITLSPDSTSLAIVANATGRRCYSTYTCGDNLNPDTTDEYAGFARSQCEVYLESIAPIKNNGEIQTLMITTRALCCGDKHRNVKHNPSKEHVVKFQEIPKHLYETEYAKVSETNKQFAISHVKSVDYNPNQPLANFNRAKKSVEEVRESESCKSCADKETQPHLYATNPKYAIRQANELSNYIKTKTLESLNDPTVKLRKFEDTGFFIKQLEYKLRQTYNGRKKLNESVFNEIPADSISRLEEHFKKPGKDITIYDLLSLNNQRLSKLLNLPENKIQKIKLVVLGVKFHPEKTHNNEGEQDNE